MTAPAKPRADGSNLFDIKIPETEPSPPRTHGDRLRAELAELRGGNGSPVDVAAISAKVAEIEALES